MGAKTSIQTLEQLCKEQPDSPISYGLGKLALGGLCLAGAGWMGHLAYENKRLFMNHRGALDLAIDIGVGIVGGGLFVGLSGYGGYATLDGVTSILKPLGLHRKDGSIFYRNGGFTNTPCWSDRKFGTIVNPIEKPLFLDGGPPGYALINDVIVRVTDLKSEQKTRLIYNAALKTTIPHPYTEYTVSVTADFKGEKFCAYTVTEDSTWADSVANLEPEKHIYLLGTIEEGRNFDIKQFGNAH